MPLALLLVIIDVMLVVHAVRTGRVSPWAFIILLVPVIGAIAYVVAVLIPDWMGSRQGLKAQRTIAKALNPERRYRELSDAVEIADTIANRAALADECLALERFEEAKRHFEVILARPMGDDPAYMGRQGAGAIRPRAGGRHDRDPRRSAPARARLPVGRRAICSMPARWKPARGTRRRCANTGRCPTTSSAPRRVCATGCCWRG